MTHLKVLILNLLGKQPVLLQTLKLKPWNLWTLLTHEVFVTFLVLLLLILFNIIVSFMKMKPLSCRKCGKILDKTETYVDHLEKSKKAYYLIMVLTKFLIIFISDGGRPFKYSCDGWHRSSET